MQAEEKNTFNFNTLNIVNLIVYYHKPLLIIAIASLIISSIVSFIIPVKYKSTVILYPANPTSISKALLSDNYASKNLLMFGAEQEAEQMLQVLESDEIRDKIIDKYNLKKHYDVENSFYPITKLHRLYKENIRFTRTEYLSIKIEVLDIDRNKAADIANDIADLLDVKMNSMQHERAVKAFQIVENEYISLKNKILSLEDSLQELRNLGIIDYESQSEVFSDAYANAVLKNDTKGAKIFEEKLANITKYGGAFVSIRDQLENEKKRMAQLEARYTEAKVDAEALIPHKFIVNKAIPAEKKATPIRWLIILSSVISTIVLTLIILIISDNIIKKKVSFLQ